MLVSVPDFAKSAAEIKPKQSKPFVSERPLADPALNAFRCPFSTGLVTSNDAFFNRNIAACRTVACLRKPMPKSANPNRRPMFGIELRLVANAGEGVSNSSHKSSAPEVCHFPTWPR